MTLDEAAAHLAAKQAKDAEERAKPLFLRLTREERAAQLKAQHEEGRARNLLHNGLQAIREGRPPTKTQMPFVQRYFAEHEAKLKMAQSNRETAEAEARYWEGLYYRIASEWNSVCDALREFGIECFGIDANQGWRGKVGDIEEKQRGYATEAEALKAALAWRLEIAKKGREA